MHWYLVHSKPHQESVAVLTLQWLGVEAFCPLQSPSFKVGQVGRFNEDPFLGLEAVFEEDLHWLTASGPLTENPVVPGPAHHRS